MRFLTIISFIALFSGIETLISFRKYYTSKIVKSNNEFALDLYKTFARSTDGGLFLSPLSVSLALAMTYIGAAGNTRSEMQRAMHLPYSNEWIVAEMFSYVQEDSQKSDDYGNTTKLYLANNLFADRSYSLKQRFQRYLKHYFGASRQNVDFVNDASGAEKLINDWVKENTHDKIKDIIPKDALDSDTRLVIANAMYFRSNWEKKFPEYKTMNDTFYGSNGKVTTMPFMQSTYWQTYGASDALECEFVQIPYFNSALSMGIYLPYENSNVANLERKLKPEHIANVNSTFQTGRYPIELRLPRFKLESTFEMKDVLRTLGIKDLFSEKADLSLMDRRRNLYVSKFLHKAFISVNENGTEASAATAVVRESRIGGWLFNASRPFVFDIRHSSTNSILFIGKYDI